MSDPQPDPSPDRATTGPPTEGKHMPSMEELIKFYGEPISIYTRAQAIADGVLVDITDTAREAGFTIPVAATTRVWSDCCTWTDADEKRKGAVGTGQSERGRTWDVVWMLRMAASTARERSEVSVTLHRVPREGRGVQPRRVTLKAVIGGDDRGEPCITLMFPDED